MDVIAYVLKGDCEQVWKRWHAAFTHSSMYGHIPNCDNSENTDYRMNVRPLLPFSLALVAYSCNEYDDNRRAVILKNYGHPGFCTDCDYR